MNILTEKYEFKLIHLLALLTVIFIIYVLSPLINALVGGIVIAFVLRPINDVFHNKTKSKTFAAALTTLFLAAPIILLFVYALYTVILDLGNIVEQLNSPELSTALFNIFFSGSAYTKAFTGIQPLLGRLATLIESYITLFPLLILDLLIMFMTMFYYLKSGEEVEKYVLSLFPKAMHKDIFRFSTPIANVLRGMLYGHLIISFIIGILSGIAYYILGIAHAPLVAALTAVASLLPILGPYAVFVPLAILEFYVGHLLKAVAILGYGVIVLTLYSNFYLYPKLGSSYSGIHPIFVLVGFLAGPLAMGAAGLVYGPLAVGMALGLLEGVRVSKEKRENAI